MRLSMQDHAKKVVCAAAAGVMIATLATPYATELASAEESSGELVVDSVAKLKELAENPGKYSQVTLTKNLTLSDSWTPIGTADEPFTGTFDGGGHSISGLQVTGSNNLGLFGYVGAGGKIKNLHITNGANGSDPSKVTATSNSEVVRNIGSIAGYVYGATGTDQFAIENCSSKATVTVTSTMKPDEKKVTEFSPEGTPLSGKTDESLANGYSDQGITIEYVGGVVGYCAGSIKNTTFSGSVSATTNEDPASDVYTTVGQSVGGVVGQVGGYTSAEEIKGTERALSKAHYPQADGNYASETTFVASVTGCENSGTVTVIATGDGGLDRFGSSVSASFISAGGIAGNAISNVTNCENAGKIEATTTRATGGVVGSLRCVNYTGNSTVAFDAGEQFEGKATGNKASYTYVSTGPTLTISNCSSKSTVSGLAQVGGIVGETGTHTRVEFCKNLRDENDAQQAVIGNRWNKPMTGGIAGMVHGDVSHCYNRVDCETATGAGFYVAGLVGCIARYTTDSNGAADSPIPVLESSYSTGTVIASGSYKQAGICGENSGTIHDCYFIKNTVMNVADPDTEEPYRPMVAVNLGTVASSVKEITASEMKTKQFCGMVNASTSLSQYKAEAYYVPDLSGAASLNDGYPVFFVDRASVEDTGDIADKPELDSSGLSTTQEGIAEYQADGNPTPKLYVSYASNGSKVDLVQGADYYVLPDPEVVNDKGGTRDISEIGNITFEANIVGIGDYRSNAEEGSSFTSKYKVARGQFSTCSVTIASKTFNYYPQFPDTSAELDKDKEVVIRDAAGNIVPFDQYTMPDDPGDWVTYKQTFKGTGDGKSHVGYEMRFSAKDNSNYEGDVYGYFQVKKAELFRDDKTDFEGFTWNGQSWKWKNSRVVNSKTADGYLYQLDSKGNEIKEMTIVYCGEMVKPTAGALKYKDAKGELRTLVLGTDYRVVYGDPGQNDLISSDNDSNTNVASSKGEQGTRPCVTVRFYNASIKCNFLNYQNLFFSIVQADVSNPDEVTVNIPSTIKSGDAKSVTLTSYTGKAIDSANYDVKFSSKKAGELTITVTGKKNLKGTFEKTIASEGTPADSDTPGEQKPANGETANGQNTSGEIGTSAKPAPLKKYTAKGITYSVTSTAKKTATVATAAKSLTKATIPATVKFNGTTYKVTAISAKAFTKAKKLKQVTIGKNVTNIGQKAFYGCSKLAKVTISTTKLSKKSLGKSSFAKTAKKTTVKVPKSKLKAYKAYLKKAGISSKAKITK